MTTTSPYVHVDAKELFADSLGLLDHLIRNIARHHGLSTAAADELAGALRMRLAANDFELLRRFRGRGSLRTYLLVIVEQQLRDARRPKLYRGPSSTFES